MCGLYDIVPTKFGVATNNIVDFVDNYGKQTEVFNGIDFAINARIRADLFVTGGYRHRQHPLQQLRRLRRQPADRLRHLRDSPGGGNRGDARHRPDLQLLRFRHQLAEPGEGHRHLHAAMAADPVRRRAAEPARTAWCWRNWNITQADAAAGTLGRALSGGANTSRSVPLVKPGTMYTPRRTQLDLRVSKNFNLNAGRRIQVMADIFNAFNSNAAVGATSNAGEPPAAINTDLTARHG